MRGKLLIALAGLLFLLGYASCTATAQNAKSDGGAPVADYQRTKESHEKAAATGDAKAMTAMGDLYYRGEGMPQDYLKAKQWYEKAAAAGNARAMSYVGELYKHGEG
jgi:TPR repeat protein